MPDLLSAVKILAGSTVEIAAASVGETSLVKAVRIIEEDGKVLDSTLEVLEPEVLEATTEMVAEEAAEEVADEVAVVVNEEELKSVEAAEDIDAPGAEEETAAAITEAARDKKEEASVPDEPTSSAPTVEEVAEVEPEDQAAVPEAAPEEDVSSAEVSPEDAAPAEEETPAEESTPAEEATTITAEEAPAAETSVEEAAVEPSEEERVEAAGVVDTIQLAAASSGSDLEVLSSAEPESISEAPAHEAKHCHSCHSSPSAAEEVAPPAALEEQLASEGAVDITHEAKEAVSLVEGQTTDTMVVVTAQS